MNGEAPYWQIVGNPGVVSGAGGVIVLVPIDGPPTGDGGVNGAVACDDRLGGAPRPEDAGVPTFDDPILPTPDVPGEAPTPEPMPDPIPDPTPEPTLPGAVLKPEPTRGVPDGELRPGCGDVMLGGVPGTGEGKPVVPEAAGVGVPATTIELGVVELKRAD
ncbi:MAG TPA: hypothetical protein VL173_09260 [Vicinamibacterales bacterium]|nr:hypothetical protein [Vicinamibacterales bacterium]